MRSPAPFRPVFMSARGPTLYPSSFMEPGEKREVARLRVIRLSFLVIAALLGVVVGCLALRGL